MIQIQGNNRTYYYRYFWDPSSGRTRKKYIGAGEVGKRAEAADMLARSLRQAEDAARRERSQAWSAIDADLQAHSKLITLLAYAALTTAGYRLHHRNEWRLLRDRNTRPSSS